MSANVSPRMEYVNAWRGESGDDLGFGLATRLPREGRVSSRRSPTPTSFLLPDDEGGRELGDASLRGFWILSIPGACLSDFATSGTPGVRRGRGSLGRGIDLGRSDR